MPGQIYRPMWVMFELGIFRSNGRPRVTCRTNTSSDADVLPGKRPNAEWARLDHQRREDNRTAPCWGPRDQVRRAEVTRFVSALAGMDTN